MPKPKLATVQDSLYWSYANLAMACDAVKHGRTEYSKVHFIIRSKLNAGLRDGMMNVRSIARDEAMKLKMPQACSYCGSDNNLSMDHLIPRDRGGPESGDNIVWACRPCNSSKGSTDMLVWMQKQNRFRPLLLLRRYLKLAITFCEQQGIMSMPLEDVASLPFDLPFNLEAVPHSYPRPAELTQWIGLEEAKPPAGI